VLHVDSLIYLLLRIGITTTGMTHIKTI